MDPNNTPQPHGPLSPASHIPLGRVAVSAHRAQQPPLGASAPSLAPPHTPPMGLSPGAVPQPMHVVPPADTASLPPAQFAEPGAYNPATARQVTAIGSAANPPRVKSKKKRFAVIGAVVAVLVAAGLVFGWYLPNTPTNVWNTGISRTGTMMDRIVAAATAPKALASYKTTAISGSVQATFNGDTLNGTFHSTFDKLNSDNGLNVSLKDASGQTKQLGMKMLTQAASGQLYPNIYFQVNGLNALGVDQYVPQVSQYDGKWILVSSDYLKSLGASYTSGLSTGNNTKQQVTASDVTAFAKTTTAVTKDYVFTTKASKAVLVKKSFVGKENMDGINTYHYKAGINAANAKAYCVALSKAIFGTQVYKKLMAGNSQVMANDRKNVSKDCSDSVNQVVKQYPTFDVWIEGHYKLLHKIRLYDPSNKTAYTDIGQTYRGGNKLAFFTDYSDAKDNTTGSFTFDTNIDTNVSNAAFSIKNTGKSSPYNVSLKLQAKAESAPVKLTKPANAVPIQNVLNVLGIPTTLQGVTSQASDTQVQADLYVLDAQLEAYYGVNGHYPTFAQMNDITWRTANLKGLDESSAVPPDSNTTTFATTADKTQYGYAPTGCTISGCAHFELSGLKSDGTLFTLQDAGTVSGLNA